MPVVYDDENPADIRDGRVFFLKDRFRNYTLKSAGNDGLARVSTEVDKGKAMAALCLGFTDDDGNVASFSPEVALRSMGWQYVGKMDVDRVMQRMSLMEEALKKIAETNCKSRVVAGAVLEALGHKPKKLRVSKKVVKRAKRRAK